MNPYSLQCATSTLNSSSCVIVLLYFKNSQSHLNMPRQLPPSSGDYVTAYSITLTKNLQIYTFSRKNHRDGNTSPHVIRTSPHSSPVNCHLPRHFAATCHVSSLHPSLQFVHPNHRSAGQTVPFSCFLRRSQPFTGQTPKPTLRTDVVADNLLFINIISKLVVRKPAPRVC